MPQLWRYNLSVHKVHGKRINLEQPEKPLKKFLREKALANPAFPSPPGRLPYTVVAAATSPSLPPRPIHKERRERERERASLAQSHDGGRGGRDDDYGTSIKSTFFPPADVGFYDGGRKGLFLKKKLSGASRAMKKNHWCRTASSMPRILYIQGFFL